MTRLKASFVIFLLILSTTKFSNAQNRSKRLTEIFKGFSIEDRVTNENVENFKSTLNFLLNYSDFQSIVISIAHLGSSGSEIYKTAAEYFHQLPVNCYQFDLDDLTKGSFDLPIGVTWIIIVDDSDVFESRIDEITKRWNSVNRFAIFFVDNVERSDEWLLNIFQFLWNRRGVSKVVISSINERFRCLYRYLPFAKINEEFGSVQRLDVVEKNFDDREKSLEVIMGKKMRDVTYPWARDQWRSNQRLIFEDFRNLNGYPIHVTVFPSMMMKITMNEKNEIVYTMLDGNVMGVVEEHLTANFIVKVLKLNKKVDPFKGALQRFDTEDKSQFIFTGYFTKLYRGNYHFTSSVFEDKLCLVAPSSKRVPKFFMPLLPFTNGLWFLLVTYNFVVAILWFSIQRFERASRDKVINRTSVEITIELSSPAKSRINGRDDRFLGFDSYRPSVRSDFLKKNRRLNGRLERMEYFNEPPKIRRGLIHFFDLSMLACSPLQGGKTNTERAFLIGTLFFSLILIGLYQSKLACSLSEPMYYPQFKTIHDVVESNRTIFTKYENLVRDLPSDGSPEFEKLQNKVKIFRSDTKTYNMVANSGMISLGRFSSFELENLTEFQDPENSRLLIHMVEECPATYSLAYVVRHLSPYRERIDRLLLRIQQAGLIKKWYSDMQIIVKMVVSQTNSRRNKKRVKLSLAHLSLIFLGLGIGLFCSTLIFLIELYLATKFQTTTTRSTIRRPHAQR